MKTHRLWLMLIAATLTASCGREPAASTSTGPDVVATSTTKPTAEPANAPLTPQRFTLADAPDLAQITNPQMIHPQFTLTPPDVDTPLLFAVLRNDDKKITSPILLKKIGAGWHVREVLLAAGQTANREWAYAAICPERHELFAILDDTDEDATAAQLTLLHSTDGGTTWQTLAAVRKPTPDAGYINFVMAASGQGRLSMYLNDDTDQLPQGYYHYATTDGGKTWTGPTREPDDIVDADSADEDTPLQDAIKDAESFDAK